MRDSKCLPLRGALEKGIGKFLFIYDDHNNLIKMELLEDDIGLDRVLGAPWADTDHFYQRWADLIEQKLKLEDTKNDHIRDHDTDQKAQACNHKMADPQRLPWTGYRR